jgi:hypothetical protein
MTFNEKTGNYNRGGGGGYDTMKQMKQDEL